MGERFKRPLPTKCPRSLGVSALEIATREATLDILSHEQTPPSDKSHFTLRRLASVPERAAEIEEIHKHCIHLMYERTLVLANGFILVNIYPDDPHIPTLGPCVAACTRRAHSTGRTRSLNSPPTPYDRPPALSPPRPRSFSLAREASFYPRSRFPIPPPAPSLPADPAFEVLSYHSSSTASSGSAPVYLQPSSRTPLSATSDGEFTLLG